GDRAKLGPCLSLADGASDQPDLLADRPVAHFAFERRLDPHTLREIDLAGAEAAAGIHLLAAEPRHHDERPRVDLALRRQLAVLDRFQGDRAAFAPRPEVRLRGRAVGPEEYRRGARLLGDAEVAFFDRDFHGVVGPPRW